MVSKQCVVCGEYFAGELNGDYFCPACQQAGVTQRLRPLASLDDFGRADVEAPRASTAAPRATKGQAA